MPPYPSIMRGGCLFVSHGGGPMPLLGDPSHASMVKFLRGHKYRPSAVLVISAHWQTTVPTLTSGAHPQLIFDYGGFPPESYRYTYAASGDGALAKRAAALLQAAGIAARLDESRGWDHGVFVPMMLMWPKADVPIVCLSLLTNADPAQHFELGRALRPLRDEGVLILGSGSSYHNMGGFFGGVANCVIKFRGHPTHWLIPHRSPTQLRRRQPSTNTSRPPVPRRRPSEGDYWWTGRKRRTRGRATRPAAKSTCSRSTSSPVPLLMTSRERSSGPSQTSSAGSR